MVKQTRRNFLKAAGLSAASLTLPGCMAGEGLSTGNRPVKKPNILFLFTDDQRFSAIGALYNREVKTPNMDKLVRGGMAFTEAHIMGSMSGAVCMPSRAMLMCGRTLFHLKGRGETIPPEHVTLPEHLKKHGYVTFGTGKWHNAKESFARSFTTGGGIFFGGMHGMQHGGHLHPKVFDFDSTGKYPNDKKYDADRFSSNLFSDEAIRFIRGHQSDKPFFMYVSYTAPHDPRMAPAEYAAMYKADDIKLPVNFKPAHPFDNGELEIRDEKLAPFPRTREVVREHIAAYYAMITHLDAQIGRVLAALEQSGRADNTIIIFAGDNGLAVGQHGLMGKQNLYEHSIRVPLIMAGPGLPKNKRSAALCYLSDIYPTLCEILGLSVPESVEGKSLVKLFKKPGAEVWDSMFYAYSTCQRGVRKGNWKLISYNVKGVRTTQLFNVEKDPWELDNLADSPEYAGRVREMTQLLKRWMHEMDDVCDIDEYNWGVKV